MDNLKEKHITFWWSVKNGNTKPKSRYVILFSLKGQYGVTGYSRSEYDNINDCNEECDELNKIYANHPIPEIIEKREIKASKYSRKHLETIWDYSNGKSWWGYIVLDMQECKAIRTGGYGFNCQNHICYNTCKSINASKETKDYFFRDLEVCPDEYIWKNGEYDGWLQFKWGDGKNAIGYVEKTKFQLKQERPGHDEWIEEYDDVTDTIKRKKIRVVEVDWNDPLPKPIKGIYYRRPNKEPVKFPNSYIGFENDYSMNEWSLSEEIAGDEYIDNGGTFKPESTSNSLGDMLGEDNPLLKLKFN